MTIQYYSDNAYHTTCGAITLYRQVDSSRWNSDAASCSHVRSWTVTP
jgi:hypothetical protein